MFNEAAAWFTFTAALLSVLVALYATLLLEAPPFGGWYRRQARARHYRAVLQLGEKEGVAVLLQVLSDLEADLATVVRHCDFEGDPRNLIFEGWRESKGGLLGMRDVLSAPALTKPLRDAGLIGPAILAKASVYYYWRAMAGLDLARPGTPWENQGTGFWKQFRRGVKRHGPKALRIGDIIADSAIAVLDAPGAKELVAAADAATSGGASVVGKSVKLAAHGTSEIKKIVEEAKITKVHKDPKEA